MALQYGSGVFGTCFGSKNSIQKSYVSVPLIFIHLEHHLRSKQVSKCNLQFWSSYKNVDTALFLKIKICSVDILLTYAHSHCFTL
jgi:hypothetical protein